MSKNIGALLRQKGDLRVEEVAEPSSPKRGEVKLAIHSVGICGSDVHYWKEGAIGDFVVREPMLLGHESSGTVLEVGEGVKHLQVGDRVAIEPGVPCRACNYCLTGRYNLCADVAFLATPPYHGDLVRRHVHMADFCYKLPDNVTFEEGALLEPLAVGVHACRRAGVTTGQNVLVCGAGPIGLVSLLVAKAFGASRVVVTDVLENRLKVARECGADATVPIRPGTSVQDVVKAVEDCFGGEKADATIECSGAEDSIRLGIFATKSGGCLLLVGLSQPEVRLPVVNAATREVDIRGVFRYANCYPLALSLVASGRINAKSLVTHRFPLERAVEAFETAFDRNSQSIKVMINCSEQQ